MMTDEDLREAGLTTPAAEAGAEKSTRKVAGAKKAARRPLIEVNEDSPLLFDGGSADGSELDERKNPDDDG